MSARDKAFAVALRSMQWKLDDAAFKAGAGSLSARECADLIDDLGNLAVLIGGYADRAAAPNLPPRIIVPGEAGRTDP